MANLSDHEQIWLVKSAGMILGPFSFLELSQALKQKKVVLLDEVRTPKQRWGYVREHPQLAELVKIVRDSEARQETNTGLTLIDKMKEDADQTESVTEDLNAELTPVPIRESVFKKVPRPQTQPSPIIQTSKQAYFLRYFIYGFIVLSVFGSGYYFSKFKSTSSISTEELLKFARHSKNQQLYKKALDYYQRVSNVKSLDNQNKYEAVPLFIAYGKDLNIASKYISELLTDSKNSIDQLMHVQNWQAVLFMKTERYEQAEEIFTKIDLQDGKYNFVSINRAYNYYLKGDLEAGSAYLRKLSNRGVQHPILTVLSAFLDPTLLRSDEISNWLIKRPDYAFTLKLVRLFLSKDGLSNQIEDLYNTTPRSAEKYLPDLDILRLKLDAQFCEKLSTSLEPMWTNKLSLLCSLEKNEMSINPEYYNSEPTLKAFVLIQQAKSELALATLTNTSSLLGFLLKAQSCLEVKDFNCFESQIKLRTNVNEQDPEAQYLLAKFFQLKNNKDLARQAVEKGLSIEAKYVPLLELREEINEN